MTQSVYLVKPEAVFNGGPAVPFIFETQTVAEKWL